MKIRVKSYKNVKTVKKNYLTVLQKLNLWLGPNHVLIYSLNFVTDVNDFIFVGSLDQSNFYRCKL